MRGHRELVGPCSIYQKHRGKNVATRNPVGPAAAAAVVQRLRGGGGAEWSSKKESTVNMSETRQRL